MRTTRLIIPGVVYHLISRVVGGEFLISDSEAREVYLRLFGIALGQCDWRALSYCLMSNHLHHSMVAGNEPVAWIRRVHSPFADWINMRMQRVGPVFARGPKAYAIRPENEGRLIAYIHNNPVRAGVVSRAANSDWSSHRAYVTGRAPSWLHVDEGLRRAGLENGSSFDEWVNATPGDRSQFDASRVRRAVRRRGSVEVATATVGEVNEVPLVACPWAHVRPDPRQLVNIVADTVGVSVPALCSRRRSPAILFGRRVAVFAALELGLTATDIAIALGFTQQAASKIASRVRDDAERVATRAIVRRMIDEMSATPVREPLRVVSVP
jgi:hypothetical protein